MQRRYKEDNVKKVHNAHQTIYAGQKVLVDLSSMAASSVEIFCTVFYSKLMFPKTGPIGIVKILEGTVTSNEDGMSNSASISPLILTKKRAIVQNVMDKQTMTTKRQITALRKENDRIYDKRTVKEPKI